MFNLALFSLLLVQILKKKQVTSINIAVQCDLICVPVDLPTGALLLLSRVYCYLGLVLTVHFLQTMAVLNLD